MILRSLVIFGALVLLLPAIATCQKKKVMVINTVSVLATKASGASWDAGDGAPDLKLRVKAGGWGGSDTTSTKNNTYSAKFNEKTIKFKAGDKVTFTVTDVDALSNDHVGTITFIISEEMFKSGGWVTPNRGDGSDYSNRIKKITFSFK